MHPALIVKESSAPEHRAAAAAHLVSPSPGLKPAIVKEPTASELAPLTTTPSTAVRKQLARGEPLSVTAARLAAITEVDSPPDGNTTGSGNRPQRGPLFKHRSRALKAGAQPSPDGITGHSALDDFNDRVDALFAAQVLGRY
jgi:hypothetical protein